MATVSTNIRIEETVKTRASQILDGLGMTLSESVNVFLRQVILKNGIPFEVKYPREENPNWATRRAMKEGDKFLEKYKKNPEKYKKNPKKYHLYNDLDEMWKDLGI